ncbi:MAG: lipid-binding SYLF domain-containing protein [Nitrospirae bacterium]|nr:lipid-binding SYLF domain-containing protein [Nitrospirota bacterium]
MAGAATAYAQEPTDEQVNVDQARITLKAFMDDPDMVWFRDSLKDAAGIIIVPAFYKAGFFLGGAGGNGVYLARDRETGVWRGPAFVNIGEASFGLQIGASKSEVVVLAMNRSAAEKLYSSSVKLGADFSIAVGPVGAGAEGALAPVPTAAFVSFIKSEGAYIGLALEGAVIGIDDGGNKAYYGRDVRPADILVTADVTNPAAQGLRDDVAEAAKR